MPGQSWAEIFFRSSARPLGVHQLQENALPQPPVGDAHALSRKGAADRLKNSATREHESARSVPMQPLATRAVIRHPPQPRDRRIDFRF